MSAKTPPHWHYLPIGGETHADRPCTSTAKTCREAVRLGLVDLVGPKNNSHEGNNA